MSSISSGRVSAGAGREDEWHSEFASKLLQDHFLLTALEFHAELIEAGREVPKLKEFFSNPVNFEQQAIIRPELLSSLPRSSSQATLDSLDLARFSEDGERTYDERVAVLEFELRKAKETISALRANLTCAAESENNKNAEGNFSVKIQSVNAEIKPHERRALNFLVNEYLLKEGYKLTSITFADENESQDFEDWDDVGLNTSRPHELILLYRNGQKSCKTLGSDEYDMVDAECQANFDDEMTSDKMLQQMEVDITDLKSQITELETKNEALEQRLSSVSEAQQSKIEVQSHNSATPEPDCFEIIDEIKSRGSSETKSLQSNGDWTKISDHGKNDNADLRRESLEEVSQEGILQQDRPAKVLVEEIWREVERTSSRMEIGREIPESFKRETLKCCDIQFPQGDDLLREAFNGVEISEATVQVVVNVLSTCLPKIIPNIILKEREEVIPLLVLTICLSPDEHTRDELLSLLFNLQKRPQEEQRQQILRALLSIAKIQGVSVTEAEVLPQCWEQIGHKYMERRLLVAESCFLLLPFVSEAIRNSLVLSIIQQLLEDREDSIRRASVSCLALLVTLISVPDKLTQLCDIAVDLLLDSSPTVSQQCQVLLLPALAQWSSTLNRLQTDLLDRLLNRACRDPTVVVISALESLLPFLVMFVAGSETVQKCLADSHPLAAKRQEFAGLCKGLFDPLVFYSGPVGNIVSAFDHLTANMEESCDWPELDWVMTNFMPRLFQLAADSWDQPPIIRSTVSLLRHLCAGLGKNVTYNLIKPEMSRRLELCSSGLIAGQAVHLEMIPLYIVGVLSLGPKDGAGLEDLGGTLFEYLCALPLCGAPLLPLEVAVECLSRMDALRVVLLDTLWDGVVHQRVVVRSATAFLIQTAIPNMPDHLVGGRIVPALVTLSSDPEMSVKVSVVPALGMLAGSSEKQTRDKITLTFQSLLQEASTSNSVTLLVALARTLAEYYEKFDISFRTDVILPHLMSLAGFSESNRNADLVKTLTDAYTAVTFSPTQLSSVHLSTYVIPGLRSLDLSARQLDLAHTERIESMLRHAERLIPISPGTPQRPLLSDSSSSLSPSAKVEEVKNKVTKMFNARPNSLQNVSGMFKKKN